MLQPMAQQSLKSGLSKLTKLRAPSIPCKPFINFIHTKRNNSVFDTYHLRLGHPSNKVFDQSLYDFYVKYNVNK